jgi:four helix bundle protein
MRKFHDLVAFKRALEVGVAVYDVTASFPRHELYGLVSQVRKAAVGVISNIAEGQGRLTYGEWRQFLSQARGSLFEVEAQMIVAHELSFLPEASLRHVRKLLAGTDRALSGLIEWVRKRERLAGKPGNRATGKPLNASPEALPPNPPAPVPRT